MPDSMQVQELSAAWDLAWQTRFCPPADSLDRTVPDAQMQEHRRACPACRERAQWPQVMEGPPVAQDPAGPGPMDAAARPLPGQLWVLNPALGGWGPKQRHFNPPVVLILRVGQHLTNSILVAQTYHDQLLNAGDEIRLAAGRFAQPWNTYTLHRDFFWRPCADFGPQTAQRVLEASQAPPLEAPPWSLLHLFRQMEVELGCFFASQAVCRLLDEHRRLAQEQAEAGQDAVVPPVHPFAGEVPGAAGGAAQVYQELLRLGLELPAGQAGTSAADLYFQALPPREELARAAAGADQGSIVPVVALNLRRGLPAAWQLLEAQVTDFVGGPQVLVGGKIATQAAGEGKWQAQFAWLDANGQMVNSLASFFEVRDNGVASFWAAFPLQAQRTSLAENRLRIRLFSKTGR